MIDFTAAAASIMTATPDKTYCPAPAAPHDIRVYSEYSADHTALSDEYARYLGIQAEAMLRMGAVSEDHARLAVCVDDIGVDFGVETPSHFIALHRCSFPEGASNHDAKVTIRLMLNHVAHVLSLTCSLADPLA